jgi:hypothetical protein
MNKVIEIDEQCEECGKIHSFLLTPKFIIKKTATSIEYLIEDEDAVCTECGSSNAWFGEYRLEWMG